jgi:hypothetical protein
MADLNKVLLLLMELLKVSATFPLTRTVFLEASETGTVLIADGAVLVADLVLFFS